MIPVTAIQLIEVAAALNEFHFEQDNPRNEAVIYTGHTQEDDGSWRKLTEAELTA